METTYEVIHGGPGRGWHVIALVPFRTAPEITEQVHASGPYTTKAQAEAKAEELSCVHDFTGNLAGAGMLAIQHPDWITTVRCRKCHAMIDYREAVR